MMQQKNEKAKSLKILNSKNNFKFSLLNYFCHKASNSKYFANWKFSSKLEKILSNEFSFYKEKKNELKMFSFFSESILILFISNQAERNFHEISISFEKMPRLNGISIELVANGKVKLRVDVS